MWMDVVGYEGIYKVNKIGEVFSVRRDRLLKPKISNGYYRVVLSKEGASKSLYIHRLVARAFISNPQKKPMVNHIDGNKLNNNKNNLEWVTASENNLHAYRLGLTKVSDERKQRLKDKPIHCKRTVVYDSNYNFLGEFRSLKYACNLLKCSYKSVQKEIGIGKHYKGYFFKYKEE